MLFRTISVVVAVPLARLLADTHGRCTPPAAPSAAPVCERRGLSSTSDAELLRRSEFRHVSAGDGAAELSAAMKRARLGARVGIDITRSSSSAAATTGGSTS